MTDRYKVYTKVLKTLKQMIKLHHPGHVLTLAMMITVIVRGVNLFTFCPADLASFGASAPGGGDGCQPGRAELHGIDGRRGVQKTSLTLGVAGLSRQERLYPC